MSGPDDSEEILERVLSGTPDRLLDGMTGGDPDARALIDASRETLASLAHALEPVAPPPALRARIAAAIAAHPRVAPRRALAVLDMIQDYLTPGRPLFVPRARGVIPAVAQRIADARRLGEPVIYLCDYHEPEDPELAFWPSHAVADTDGWKVVPELAPHEGDLIVPHRTYSAFFESKLDTTLRERGIDTLVLTGCATELGLLATATDALMRGYKVEVPPDAQAGASEAAERLALGVIGVMRPLEPFASR